MFCPKCHCEKTSTTGVYNGYAVERCRRCADCNYSWLTIETVKFDKDLQQHAKVSEDEAKERRTDHRRQNNRQ